MVTGGTEPNRWWCYAFAWVLAAFIIIYCIFVVIISIVSLFTYNNAIDNINQTEHRNKISDIDSNHIAKQIIDTEEEKKNIENFYGMTCVTLGSGRQQCYQTGGGSGGGRSWSSVGGSGWQNRPADNGTYYLKTFSGKFTNKGDSENEHVEDFYAMPDVNERFADNNESAKCEERGLIYSENYGACVQKCGKNQKLVIDRTNNRPPGKCVLDIPTMRKNKYQHLKIEKILELNQWMV